MQVFLSLLGLLMAIGVWNSGHPVLAILVGFLFIGGAGWMLPVWLGRGAVTATRTRSSALPSEWRRRGYPGDVPELATVLWGTGMWPSIGAFFDDVAATADHAITKFRVEAVDTPGHGTVQWGHVKVTTVSVAPIPALNVPGFHGEAWLSYASTGALQALDRFSNSLYMSPSGPVAWGSGSPFSWLTVEEDRLWVQISEYLYATTEERAEESDLGRWLQRHAPERRRATE